MKPPIIKYNERELYNHSDWVKSGVDLRLAEYHLLRGLEKSKVGIILHKILEKVEINLKKLAG